MEALCRDKDSVVRGTMCVRLPEVIVKLKEKDKVFPILNNLLNDMDGAGAFTFELCSTCVISKITV